MEKNLPSILTVQLHLHVDIYNLLYMLWFNFILCCMLMYYDNEFKTKEIKI